MNAALLKVYLAVINELERDNVAKQGVVIRVAETGMIIGHGWAMQTLYYPHMPKGKIWIYRLLFVCLFVCMVLDFSGEDKASGVKFCTVVYVHPGQGFSHFGELYSPEAQNRMNRPPTRK